MDHIVRRGIERLTSGKAQIRRAQKMVREQGPTRETEEVARGALPDLRSAMDCFEDTEDFELAHHALDAAGRFIRRTFGCHLFQEGLKYEQQCPIALAHSRVGLSPLILADEIKCSICGADPEVCSHVTGRYYEGQRCGHVITRSKILEVSIVSRPANPDARFTAVQVALGDLRRDLGSDFMPGMRVSCDRCLSPCSGVHEANLEDLAGGVDVTR